METDILYILVDKTKSLKVHQLSELELNGYSNNYMHIYMQLTQNLTFILTLIMQYVAN